MVARQKEVVEVPLPDVIVVSDARYAKMRRGKKPGKMVRHAGANGRVPGRKEWHTDKQKMDAACAFAVTGNSRRVSELTGIDESTVRRWKCTEWWNEIQSRIVREKDEELDTKLTAIMDKTVVAINDRIDNGDYLYNVKADKLIRKPVGAKDLASVTATMVDKRQLLRGLPTSRTEKVSQDERLKGLAAQFKRFVSAKEIVQLPEEIENETKDAYEEDAPQQEAQEVLGGA